MSAEPTKPPIVLKAVNKTKPTDEIGAPGLKEFGGFLQEEFVTDLRGQRGALRYREMVDNCPAIDAALTTMKNTALRAIGDGRVEPFSADSEDQERAEFVQQCLDDMCHSRSDMDTEALTMFEHGFAPMNIVYKRRGGFKLDEELSSRYDDEAVGWKKVSLRAQESVLNWQFDEEGRRVLGLVQIPAPTYVQYTIPIDRLALFRTSAVKGSPEGRSLLRSAYFAWTFFKRGTTMGWVGAERDVTGIPVLKGPGVLFSSSQTTDQAASYARLKQIGENVRNDEQACVLLPSDVDPETKQPLYTFELVSSPGTKVMDVPAMTRDQERQILMVLFSDFLLLGHEKIGTQALFSGRMGLYAMQLDALLDRYDETLNRQMIPRLGLMNGWPMDRLPYFTHGRVAETALEDLGKFLQAYVNAGGILDPGLDAYVREAAGWPAPSVEDTGIPMQRPPKPEAEGELGEALGGSALGTDATQVQLNGAQVTAATAIVVAVVTGQLPRDSGLGQLMVLFNLNQSQAEAIMGSAGTKTPTTPNPIGAPGSGGEAGSFAPAPDAPSPEPRPKGGHSESRGEPDGSPEDALPEVDDEGDADEPPEVAKQVRVAKSPPWHVERRGDKFVVLADETGEQVGEHDTEAEAEAHLRALYANVDKGEI